MELCLSMLKARAVLMIDKNVEHLTRVCDWHYIGVERDSQALMAGPDPHRYLGI
jgi:branched-chain amino acid transport system ATP-binding protein